MNLSPSRPHVNYAVEVADEFAPAPPLSRETRAPADELRVDPDTGEASRERYRNACRFVGTEPGRVWTRAQEELFARAGERFLLEGVTPNPRMGDVMESFRQWMSEVYAGENSRQRTAGSISPRTRWKAWEMRT